MSIYKISLSDEHAENLVQFFDRTGGEVDARVAEQIRAQIPLPAIEEPTEFGSIVRAWHPDDPKGVAADLWQRSPRNGKHYWENRLGNIEIWSELVRPEVLRVGIGETGNGEDYKDGFSEAKLAMRQQLRNLRSGAITAERQNAYDKAIAVVKEIQP